MRKVLLALVVALTSIVVVSPSPAVAASEQTWSCDLQGPVTLSQYYFPSRQVILTGYRWSFSLSGSCTSIDGRHATMTSDTRYTPIDDPTTGLCSDVGLFPSFEVEANPVDTYFTAEGQVTQWIPHRWTISSTTGLGGPASNVNIGGNQLPPHEGDVYGSGISFHRLFGKCPELGKQTETSNGRFLLSITQTPPPG